MSKHDPVKITDRQTTYAFPNGYGASVINDGYGGDSGRFELAVLKDDRLTYETPITDDVLGWLTEDDVEKALDQIAALTPESVEAGMRDRAAAQRRERISELRAELARLEAQEAGA